MRKKDQVAIQAAVAAKALRTAIRLKHSLAADAEINEELPRLEEAIYAAAAAGKPFKLDIGSVFDA